MSKFHVNQRTGDVGRCTASVKECPLGSNANHFDNQKDAQSDAERVLSNIHGNVSTVKKTVKISRVDVNEDFPHPQANRLDKVSTTVDAIYNGATTPASLSHALDVVDRQGSYYGDAAGYLGLVEERKDGEFKEYYLTSKGELFVEQDAAGREQILRETIDNMPLMQIYREEGDEAAMGFIQDTQDLGDTTASRRLTTLKTWDDTLASSISESIEADRADGESRFVEASQYAAEQKQKRLETQKKTEARGTICPTCFMEMSLSGECSNCD